MSDLIDREELYHDMTMKRLELHEKGLSWNEFCRGFGFAMEFVKNAPSAEPERKTGKWIGEWDTYDWDGEPIVDIWRCSVCDKVFCEWEEKPDWKYCPNCGAEMRDDNE